MILVGILFLLLEGVLSNYVGYVPFFFPVRLFFTFFYVMLLYYLNKDFKKTMLIAGILGLIYDICYTDIYFLHSMIYLATLFFLKRIDQTKSFPLFKIFLSFLFFLLLEYLFGMIYRLHFPSIFYLFSFYLQALFTNSIFFLLFFFLFYVKKIRL